jgi:iron complex outermembrane receptor protein
MPALGQTAPDSIAEVTVQGAKEADLTTVAPTGSRLGLTPLETPAALDTITAAAIAARGLLEVQDAAASLPGVTGGGSPGDPSSYSMRGFTNNQITILHDGLYYGPSDMVGRPQNSENLESVEILKGPASVLYGQGAVGGAINTITKSPVFGPTSVDGLLSYGSFNTIDLAAGFGTQINDQLAVRADFSRNSTDGYVHNNGSDALDFTGSLLWKAREANLTVRLGFDYTSDNLAPSYGTPLVPGSFATDPLTGVLSSTDGRTLDARMRYNNYDAANATLFSSTYTPTATITWHATDALTLESQTFYSYAMRHWNDAEQYHFTVPGDGTTGFTDGAGQIIPAGVITRDRFFVDHQEHELGEVATATYESDLFGLPNKVTAGIDYTHINFVRRTFFDDGGTSADGSQDYVNALNPSQGSIGPYVGEYAYQAHPTTLDSTTFIAEDALDLTSNLKLVTGVQAGTQHLDRGNYTAAGVFNAQTSFERDFSPANFRIGAVYTVLPKTALYAQFTTAQDPAGNNIFLVNANNNVGLSHSDEGEVGAKTEFDDNKGFATVSLYEIKRSHILTQTGVDTAVAGGSENSKGFELSGDYFVLPKWDINANAAYTFATFGEFTDPNTGASDAGDHPANVPNWVFNAYTAYHNVFDSPVDIGGGIRYVGTRYGTFNNSLRLDPYTLLNIFAAYHVNDSLTITGRIDNLNDKAYAIWADTSYSGNEVQLGAPRSFSLTAVVHF